MHANHRKDKSSINQYIKHMRIRDACDRPPPPPPRLNTQFFVGLTGNDQMYEIDNFL